MSVVVFCFVAGGSCRHTNIQNSNYCLRDYWRLTSPFQPIWSKSYELSPVPHDIWTESLHCKLEFEKVTGLGSVLCFFSTLIVNWGFGVGNLIRYQQESIFSTYIWSDQELVDRNWWKKLLSVWMFVWETKARVGLLVWFSFQFSKPQTFWDELERSRHGEAIIFSFTDMIIILFFTPFECLTKLLRSHC